MKHSMVFTLFYISAPLLLVARVLQQFYMLDPETGFYLDSLGSVGKVVSVMCFVLVAALYILVWLSQPRIKAAPKRGKALAIGSFAAAMCLLISSAQLVVTATGAKDVFVAIFAFPSALCFAWYGASLITNIKYPAGMSIVPIIYGVVRLIATFMNYTGEVTVTDSLFDIATMCFLLLFLYSSGKIICGLKTPRSPVMFYASGLSAAFFCIDECLAKTIAAVTGNVDALHSVGAFNVTYIGFAIYIILMIHTVSAQSVGRTRNA